MNTILIIDDDLGFQRLLEKVLSKEGYRVHSASDGKTGLERFHDLRPDVVITDIFMPVKDGLEVITELAAAGCAQKVIAVTGKIDAHGETYLEMARMMTASFAFEKPVNMQKLRAAIDVIVAGSPVAACN